jgi:hypothetical protein
MTLKDIFKEINTYVANTGMFEKIKINVDNNIVSVEAFEKERGLVKGKFTKAVPEIAGSFGLKNLNMLNIITNDPEYLASESTITVNTESRDGQTYLASLTYVNKSQTEIYYRFMSSDLLPKNTQVREPQYEVTVNPARSSIQQFIWAGNGLSSVEQYFNPQIRDRQLRFCIGEDGAQTSRGGVVFAQNIDAKMQCDFHWKVSDIQTVLKLNDSADCEVAISGAVGAIQIKFQTGQAQWQYVFPGKVK